MTWDALPEELWTGVYEAIVHNNTRVLLDVLSDFGYANLGCAANAYNATRYQPAEPCENISLPGSDYCWEHNYDEEV